MGSFKRGLAKLRCSFCGQKSDAVKKLIAGPSVFICNECVNVCVEILVDDARTTGTAVQQALPSLAEVETELLNSQYFSNAAAQHKYTH